MKRARDFREIAWNTLRGRYWWAVLAALIAIMLGGYAGQSPIGFHFRDTDNGQIADHLRQVFHGSFDISTAADILRPLMGVFTAVAGLAFVYAVGMFIVGCAVELGYNVFNLSLYESTNAPRIETLFSRFSIFGNALVLRLLMLLKILLWTLLLIIPGIVAAYRYAMAPYLLAEHPELSATEAIEQSKVMMSGNKGTALLPATELHRLVPARRADGWRRLFFPRAVYQGGGNRVLSRPHGSSAATGGLYRT